MFTAPQEQVHSLLTGMGFPHSEQNFPVFTVPQEQVQLAAGAGCGLPHSEQNFPVFTAPQEQVQPAAALAGFI